MALAEVLRERVSRKGRRAQVDCGALGTVTVEALSPKECAALGLRESGRALLYAGCRELQAAGETLRRERRLFTPDEVTQYISDEEALEAARVILALSGQEAGESGLAEAARGAAHGEQPDSGASEVASGEGMTHGAVPEDGADGLVQEAGGNTPGAGADTQGQEAAPGIWSGPDSFAEEAGTDSDKSGKFEEFRLLPVQSAPAVRARAESRLASVQEDAAEFGAVPATKSAEIRLDSVQSDRGTGEAVPAPTGETVGAASAFGQVSRETGGTATSFGWIRKTDKKAQGMESSPPGGTQNVVQGVPPMTTDGGPEETGAARLHEMKSEFPEPVHESKSEFRENEQARLHESESEFAERTARLLLEGLRRAAAAR